MGQNELRCWSIDQTDPAEGQRAVLRVRATDTGRAGHHRHDGLVGEGMRIRNWRHS